MPKHARRRFDDDNTNSDDHHIDRPPVNHRRAAVDEQRAEPPHFNIADDDEFDDEPSWSTYGDDFVAHGPSPTPPWVITSLDAVDTDLGVFKTGKEADVSLLRRAVGDTAVLMAVKRYRSNEHRLFHRDAAYLEGRKEQKSRERRAMATRTSFGRALIAGRWASAEFDVLGRLWSAGAAVPYPVQLIGTELMMEFIGSPDGTAAPRLAQIRPERSEAMALYEQMRSVLGTLAEAGFAHGDLSAYNVLVDDGRLVLIDLPQAVDLVGNPRAVQFMSRDCENICHWFAARGVAADHAELARHLLHLARWG